MPRIERSGLALQRDEQRISPPDGVTAGPQHARERLHRIAWREIESVGAGPIVGASGLDRVSLVIGGGDLSAREAVDCLKLLAVAKNLGDKLEARVHPVMIPADHILANVNEVYNAIYLEGDLSGPSLYYGLGAGRRPTGSAVASDVIDIAREIRCGIRTSRW